MGQLSHLRHLLVTILAIAGLPVLAADTTSTHQKVDVELVQAIDASASVDDEEWRLQLAGIAAAFRDKEVLAAIKAGPTGRIAVALMSWADAAIPKDASDWFIIDSFESADTFARLVERFPRRPVGGTGIGSALAEAVRLMEFNDIDGARQVVDVSGDGAETAPGGAAFSLPEAISMADAYGVTVNGLAIVTQEKDLEEYYRNHVVTGPGHFVLKANDYVAFRAAVRAKLIREILPAIGWQDPVPAKRFSDAATGIFSEPTRRF